MGRERGWEKVKNTANEIEANRLAQAPEEGWIVSHNPLRLQVYYRNPRWRHHSSWESSEQLSHVMAASFHTCFDSKCSAFKITRLIYVHCVSEEQFSVNLKGVECVILHCREMHWSYLESMSEWRVSLIPTFVDEKTSEELFAGLRSPVLIRINCSCDITVSIF